MKCFPLGLMLALASTGVQAIPVPSPTVVRISGRSRDATIDVRNEGEEVETYKLSVVDWKQTSNGEMIFGPAKEISIDRSSLTLRPHETQKLYIRVTNNGASAEDEQTYRLIFMISDSTRSPQSGESHQRPWRVGRIDMPILVGGTQSGQMPNITGSAIDRGIVHIELHNPGHRTFKPAVISVVGMADNDKSIFKIEQNGWYVLPKSYISYELSVSNSDCVLIRKIVLTSSSADLKVATSMVPGNHFCSAEQTKTEFVQPKPSFHDLSVPK